jgi:ADP-ribose pyrophosphatase
LAADLVLLAVGYVSPGFTDERVHLFEATGLRAAPGRPDDGEDLEVAWLDLDAAWRAASTGELVTSMVTPLGLRHARAQRRARGSCENGATDADPGARAP